MNCSISGCGRKLLAKGYCSRHYTQWRKHGDPLCRVIAERGAPLAWITAHVDHDGDACLTWPFKARYSNGYGSAWFRGGLTGAHRVMCILAHGEPPFEGAEAAHNCGKGREACLNPRHLRWATQEDNNNDKILHGTTLAGDRNPQARLTWNDVSAIIKRAAAGEKHTTICLDYGVNRSNVSQIVRGVTWRTSDGD